MDHGSDAFGNILRKKRQVLPELSEGPQARQSERHTQALLDAYFGEDSALPEDEQFLKNYISKKAMQGPLVPAAEARFACLDVAPNCR